MNVIGLFGDYGKYTCNVGNAMDQVGIPISKMGQLSESKNRFRIINYNL